MKLQVILLFLIFEEVIYLSQQNDVKAILEKPRIMGDKIPFKTLITKRTVVQKKIVAAHNHYRSVVNPPAANMLRMTWHAGAKRNAQRWADSCVYLQHNNRTERLIRNYGTCGQNIFVSSVKVPWVFVVRSWFKEKYDFRYGRFNHTGVIGHYTQVVWATSHKVGCGVSKCAHRNGKTFYNYVCDYCPSGNIQGLQHVPYRVGRSCTDCRNSCSNKLCSNTCPFVNKFSNCIDLYKSMNKQQFCHNKFKNDCKAVCKCPGKIYQRFDQLNSQINIF